MTSFKLGAPKASKRAAVCLLPLMLLSGCAAFPAMQVPQLVSGQEPTSAETSPTTGQESSAIIGTGSRPVRSMTIPGAPPRSQDRPKASAEQIAALLSEDLVDANLAPQTIPQFVASVFGGVLNLPFTMGPDVANRTEIIAGGSGGPITKRALFGVAQQALSQYGVDLYIDGNAVTVGASRQGGAAPEITRGYAPSGTSGRVVHFYAAQTVEVAALQQLLNDLYPNLRGTRITAEPISNNLIISGSGREVAQVVRALRDIDQPRFSGAEVISLEPAFWGTDAMATALEQVLATEGFLISRQAIIGRSVVILAFPTANQILVFARDPQTMDRVRYWANQLDQPASLGDKASTFVYQVRNTDAQSLGQMAMGQGNSNAPTARAAPTGVPGTPPATSTAQEGMPARQGAALGQGGQFLGGRLLVDSIGNRIIFTGTASDFASLRALLSTLDTPAPQVVIEIMIAEVTLNDNTSIGVQLFGSEERGDGLLTGGTEAIELPGGGLLATFTGSDIRARLTAASGNSRVNILQRPQLVARSGGSARFQVGTDVPVITSQRATQTQTGDNGSDILQTVQYRQTGVILDLQPVVYGDRVDITISQEISEVGRSSNPAIASPPILNRSLTTQIALTDGWTGVLGGLISNNYSKSNSGVPFLKDVPIIGSAFQSNAVTGARTELLILITPHVIRGDEDMSDLADRYTTDMNAAYRTGRGWSYTLTPFNPGFGVKGLGLNLPQPNRPSEVQAQREARRQARLQSEQTSDDDPTVPVTDEPVDPSDLQD